MTLQQRPLGDICEVIAGQHIPAEDHNQSGKGIPYLTGPADFGIDTPIISKWTDAPRQFARSTDVLVTVKGAGVGKSNYGLDVAIGRQLMALRPQPNVLDRGFLFHWIRANEQKLNQLAQGATVPGIGKSDLETLATPVPQLEEQRRIADILDKADAIRRKRKAAIALTEELLRSAFLEMFGDSLNRVETGRVPAGWSLMAVDDLKALGPYTCVGGPFGSNLTSRDYVEDGVPVIRGTNLGAKTNTFIDDGFVFVSETKANALLQNMAYPGDLIFTQRGTLGQVALIPADARYPRYVVSQSQMKLTPHAGLINPLFLHYFFCTDRVQRYIASHALTTGVPHINLGILREIPVLVPPKALQDAFAGIVERSKRIRLRQTESSVCADALFSSLLHKAFRGELTTPTSKSASPTPKQLSLLE